MTTTRLISMAALASFGALAASASAGMTPPYSGPGATFQCWDFAGPVMPSPADPGYINPFGVPMAGASAGAVWQPSHVGKSGVWALDVDPAGLSDFLNFRIPNHDDPDTRKRITVEIKYFGIPGTSFLPPIVSGEGLGAPPEPITFTSFTSRPAGNNPDWSIGTWTGFLTECPLFETITVAANPNTPTPTVIDWVCIGTLCVPTPGAGAMVFAGAVLAGVRRRWAGNAG